MNAVRVETTLENSTGQDQSFSLDSELIAPDGRAVAKATTSGLLADGKASALNQAGA